MYRQRRSLRWGVTGLPTEIAQGPVRQGAALVESRPHAVSGRRRAHPLAKPAFSCRSRCRESAGRTVAKTVRNARREGRDPFPSRLCDSAISVVDEYCYRSTTAGASCVSTPSLGCSVSTQIMPHADISTPSISVSNASASVYRSQSRNIL